MDPIARDPTDRSSVARSRFDMIVDRVRADPAVTIGGPSGRGFGTGALQVDGHIFVMVASGDRLVFKLPRPRVDDLVAVGAGARFDPGHGRIMREWFVLDAEAAVDWLALAEEARRHVGAPRDEQG